MYCVTVREFGEHLEIIAIIGDFEVPLFSVTLKGSMIPVEQLLWADSVVEEMPADVDGHSPVAIISKQREYFSGTKA